jgi:glutamine synthetase
MMIQIIVHMATKWTADDFDQVRLIWTDLDGIPRRIVVPAHEYESILEDGAGFANSVLNFTLEPGSVEEPAYPAEGGDMIARSDTDTRWCQQSWTMALDWYLLTRNTCLASTSHYVRGAFSIGSSTDTES